MAKPGYTESKATSGLGAVANDDINIMMASPPIAIRAAGFVTTKSTLGFPLWPGFHGVRFFIPECAASSGRTVEAIVLAPTMIWWKN